MSFKRLGIKVRCDWCGKETDAEDTEWKARSEANESGWYINASGSDYCPECKHPNKK